MRPPKYQEIVQFLKTANITQKELAASLSFSPPYLNQLILGDRQMSDATLDRINRLLNTNFRHPEPIPEILPHEQLALDRKSLKDKPLFKE